MGFASEGVSMVGGVDPVGQGRSAPYVNAQIGGLDPSRGPMAGRGWQPMGWLRPRLQIPVAVHPWEKIDTTRAPGLSGVFGRAFMTALNFLASPQPTRAGNVRTIEERMEFMSGTPGDQPDPETRGLTIEPASSVGVTSGESGGQIISSGMDYAPQAIINTPPDGFTDNLAVQVQGWPTTPHEQLSAFRQSWPAAPVNQAPALAVNVVLAQQGFPVAGAFVGEINIPQNAVTARITWTTTAGVAIDLWWSLTAQAFIPVGTAQPGGQAFVTQSSPSNDGLLLNPNQATQYLVKGKRAISFATAVACTVHVEFYSQAG